MKKLIKISLILGLIISLAGLVFLGIGLSQGSLDRLQKLDNRWQKKKIYLDRPQYLDLNFKAKNIEIKEGSGKRAKVTYYTNRKEKISHTVTSNSLSLNQEVRWHFNLVGVKDLFQWFSSKNPHKVILTIPKNTLLKKVTISNNAGNITFDRLHIAKLDLEQNAGNLTIKNSRLDSGNIDIDVGNTSLTNSRLSAVKVTSDTGNITADNITILNTVKLSNDTGNTDVSLSSRSFKEATVSAKTDTGNTHVSDELLDNYSKNHLIITGDTGNIKVE